MKTILSMILIIFCTCMAHADRYAILVGNNIAKGEYAELKYVKNDIDGLKKSLSGFCGFESRNITTLYNKTPQELQDVLASLAKQLSSSKDNMFLLYYSGHADQNGLKMGDLEFSFVTLKQVLSSFPADIRIGIFDACQSGSFTRVKGGKLDEPFLFKDDTRAKGQVILCSSSINENAQESDAIGNSVFTFHFVNALRGSGDVSGDGKVTLSEAYNYSYNKTISSTTGSFGGIQHPSFQFRIQGEGDIVLADLNIRTQGLLLSRGLEGDVTILNENKNVVADVSKAKSASMIISLNPGTYHVINGRNNARFQCDVVIAEKKIVTIKAGDFESVEAKDSRKKGIAHDRSVQVGLVFSGLYGQFDFSSIQNSMNNQFTGYNDFGIYPRINIDKSKLFYGLGCEVIVRSMFVGYLTAGAAKWVMASDYRGSRTDLVSDKKYSCSLHLETTIDASMVDIGAGYRFVTKNIIKNTEVILGCTVVDMSVKSSSTFSDSLYDIVSLGSNHLIAADHAMLLVPFISLGYMYPVSNWCDVGAHVRYRYQDKSKDLSYENYSSTSLIVNAPSIPYTFKGFDAGICAYFHVTFKKNEE